MSEKTIIELTQRSDFDATCNIPVDDGIQTWRVSGQQVFDAFPPSVMGFVVRGPSSASTIDIPATARLVMYRLWGAAGGGGNAQSSGSTAFSIGAGGGGGGYAEGWLIPTLLPTLTLHFEVGTGGNGGANAASPQAGSAGGITYLRTSDAVTIAQSTGGGGGEASAVVTAGSVAATPGAGGVATGNNSFGFGYWSVNGGQGNRARIASFVSGIPTVVPGASGGSFSAPSVCIAAAEGVGPINSGFSGGGGGALRFASTNGFAGGAGGHGRLHFIYYS